MEKALQQSQSGGEVRDDQYRLVQKEVVKLALLHSPELVEMIRAELKREDSVFNDPTQPGGPSQENPDQKAGDPLSRVVGNPAERASIEGYDAEVDAIMNEFRVARRRAWQTVAKSALWREKGPLLLFRTGECLWSLFCLRLAGWLYRAHIVAVIDSTKHAQVLSQAFSFLPAPSA